MTIEEALAKGNQLWGVMFIRPGEMFHRSVTMETYADAVDFAAEVRELGCRQVMISQVTAVQIPARKETT